MMPFTAIQLQLSIEFHLTAKQPALDKRCKPPHPCMPTPPLTPQPTTDRHAPVARHAGHTQTSLTPTGLTPSGPRSSLLQGSAWQRAWQASGVLAVLWLALWASLSAID